MKCFYCQNDFQLEEVRPYGLGGSYICYPCMVSDTLREKLAIEEVTKLLSKIKIPVVTSTGIKDLSELEDQDVLPILFTKV